jgi:MoaA/NifB/PqqE/SkfB family radical SAM enzyme
MLELEITARCPLRCLHCLSSSSPESGHGSMTLANWRSVIDQAVGLGIPAVQLIGGEPTSSPHCVALAEHALTNGLQVEVFTNLHTVSRRMWAIFSQPGVSLATSYYSLHPDKHDEVTHRVGSHTRNRANLIQALRRGIPVRVGIIEVVDGQDIQETHAEIAALGVPPSRIRVDRTRAVGRAARTDSIPELSELCGRCGLGRAAVLPDGEVTPCVLGRWLRCGNVRQAPLAAILSGDAWRHTMARVPRFERAGACNPGSDGGDCAPAEKDACAPDY